MISAVDLVCLGRGSHSCENENKTSQGMPNEPAIRISRRSALSLAGTLLMFWIAVNVSHSVWSDLLSDVERIKRLFAERAEKNGSER